MTLKNIQNIIVYQCSERVYYVFMVTAARKNIGLLILLNINKDTHTYLHKHTPDGHSPLAPYIRGPVATGQNRSHLNRAFVVHRWAPFPPPLCLFFIVLSRISISVTANESRSACAGLLLQARWDSIQMTFGGRPSWCRHHAARDGYSYSLNRQGATWIYICTHK